MRPISLKITLRKIKEIKIESEDIERRESGTAEPGSWGGFSCPPPPSWKIVFGNFQWIALLLLTLIRLILTSYSRTQVKYIKVFTRWNEAVEVPVILQVIQIEFFWMKYLMENVENSISEPLNSKSFGGMICHRFQATPAPPRQLKIHSAVLGEKKKQAIDALISYEGGLSSILARSSFHKSWQI